MKKLMIVACLFSFGLLVASAQKEQDIKDAQGNFTNAMEQEVPNPKSGVAYIKMYVKNLVDIKVLSQEQADTREKIAVDIYHSKCTECLRCQSSYSNGYAHTNCYTKTIGHTGLSILEAANLDANYLIHENKIRSLHAALTTCLEKAASKQSTSESDACYSEYRKSMQDSGFLKIQRQGWWY